VPPSHELSDQKGKFLKKILQDLDSDHERQFYAGWLKQNGFEDRSDFIVMQCIHHAAREVAHGNRRLINPTDLHRFAAVEKEEQRLFRKHEEEWRTEEDPPEGIFVGKVQWERGFPYFGTIDWANVDKDALADAMKNHPIQGIVVNNLTATNAEDFFKQSWMEQLRHLVLEGNEEFGDEGVKHLTACPSAQQLQFLNLMQCGITLEGAKTLAASPNLEGLNVLRIANNNITADGVYALANAAHFPALWKIIVREASHDGAFYQTLNPDKMGKFTENLKMQEWMTREENSGDLPGTQKVTPETITHWSQTRVQDLLSHPNADTEK